MIEKIRQRELFAGTIEGGGFMLKIESYQPALCAAIHHGGRMRDELKAQCRLTEPERYYEEDPFTGDFISKQPITMIAHDSRYEYDLNRSTDKCVYQKAWGKEVWKTPLSVDKIAISKEKHAQFYRVLSSIVEALIESFGQCIVYDTHAYNYRRHERNDLPVFNLGTSSVKSEKWRPFIDAWLKTLQQMQVDGVHVTAAENDIFFGKGYLAAHCHGRYDDVLVLATEVKKVYMNELNGEPNSEVLHSLQEQFNQSVASNTAAYMRALKESC